MINVTKHGQRKIDKAVQELKSLVNDGKDRSSDRQQITEQSQFVDRKHFGGKKKMEEELDFFLSNNASQPKNMQQKKIKVYNTTRINSRNVLTNISSNEVKEENFFFWQLRTDNKKH